MKNKKILGIIVARGGSKRLPRKNIKKFLGKPLIVWSIEVGMKSKVFDKFILTTDDKEIAKIGKKFGIETPFLRPSELATDTASSFDTVKHTINWLKENKEYYVDWVVLLEPTSPGRQTHHLKEVVKIINEKYDEIDSVTAISELPGQFHPLKIFKMNEDGTVLRNTGKLIRESVIRNQELTPIYYPNSALYAFKTSNLFHPKHPSLWGNKTFGYIMDEKYAMNIDTYNDWIIAESKMKNILKNKK